ncbi:MAG: GMC family oxidoreductase N-terminal domain-containing protein [Deltaproteobacteria bacterium]|nr:GMC family oxidoreductase N-terminal domain-containing protein [Deltaproteobacteria bacterium]
MSLREREIHTRVCVVGSGAGGATVAKELAEKGVDVLILEMGAHHKPEEFTQREDQMMARLFQKGGATGNKNLSVLILMGQGVGGSTVHNGCLCFRPPKAILARWEKEYGVRDIAPSELMPYIRRAEANIGANQAAEWEVNRNNDVLRRGADALGWKGKLSHHNRVACVGCGYCTLGARTTASRACSSRIFRRPFRAARN